MKFTLITLKGLLLAAGVAAFGVSLASAQTASTPTTPVPPTTVPAVRPPLPTAIQEAIDAFSAKRDALIAARKAILDQLKTATPAERQAIIDKLRADAKDLVAQQRALGKEIRDQLRELRKTAPTSGGGG